MASDDRRIAQLAPRRRAILELVARGLTNERIGAELGISPGTVRIQMSAIIEELGVGNRAGAAVALATYRAQPAVLGRVLARPAIAVLPILSPPGRGDRIGCGMTQDLTSLFARWCTFPVIARVSSARAREHGTAGQIGAWLGARFLVDGALRKHAGGWRLSISVADADDGLEAWAERYDFRPSELFEVEAEVCEAVVAASNQALLARVGAGVRRHAPTEDLAAWELAHQGLALEALRERKSNALARARLDAALKRDPDLALAHFAAGLVSYGEVLNQWGPPAPALDALDRSADRCVALAPDSAEGHYLRGRHCQAIGRPGEAITPLLEAVGRNPSFAPAHALLAQVLILGGRGDEGMVRMKHAVRLDPHSYVAGMAAAHFSRRAYAEGLVEAERAVAASPGYAFARVVALACAFWLGDRVRAAAHMAALRRTQPAFDPDGFLQTFGPNREVARVGKALKALS